uniref:Cytochrome c oxidase assembly factor 5 n=1 Tax=Plectus sambesii TaxID=2011161 RepID=A0A914WIR7_9BILA
MSSTPAFTDEEELKAEQAKRKTGRACDRLRQELKACIKESDCVQVLRRSATECINATDGSVPRECFHLLTSFSDCKRSMVDMRSRFRGRKGDMD